MSDLSNRVAVVFTEAVQLPAKEQAEYLERACGGDVKLRQQVDAMLAIQDSVGDFLEQSPQKAPRANRLGAFPAEKAGDRIGRYKLLQQIGEGGCGVVYMAEQEKPVRRLVALKIIKPGMDTKSVIARFEAERQALALMDHPNIAKIFDADATESGRPYFVMELVRGVKITEYCDQNSLTTEERLKLLTQVCQAIQHAHQKGIIHRDIKPSNILVATTGEGAALPVVIDFGIAKATTNQQLTDKTLFTAFEMLIGTPAYMSPEQAALTSVDVDTRTDIYSLGVLLYELLTGTTPFDVRELLKAGLDEVRRVIREQEPVRPSTRLSKLTKGDLTVVAQHHRSEPPTLIRAVLGDLDWIAMKALEKDRARRYETANGLALDIQRFLANETVSARPPSAVYKFQKTVLRNKLLFSGLAAIALFLVVSLFVVSAALAKERRSRREAEAAKAKAESESVKSQQVTHFLEDMLQGVGPSIALGQDTKLLAGVLDRTAARVGSEMTNQPAVEAELRTVISRIYLELGNYPQAETMESASLVINRKLFGSESPEAAASLNDVGLVFLREGKAAEAEIALGEALRIRRRLYSNDDMNIAVSLGNLAAVYNLEGRLPEGEALVREADGIWQKRFGTDSLEAANSLRMLSIFLAVEGKYAEAEATARRVLSIRRAKLNPDDPLIATALTDVAYAIGFNSRGLEEAELLEREALAIRQKVLPQGHPDIAKSLYLIGDRLHERGKLNEAYALLTEALSMQRKFPGENNPTTLDTLHSLGETLEAQGKLAESEQLYREALDWWRKRKEDKFPQGFRALASLAQVLVAQKKYGDAEQLLNESLTPTTMSRASGDLLALKFDIEARRGQWKAAADDAALAVEHQPLNSDRYAVLAALLVKTQNRPAYEHLRKQLLAAFANTTNIFVADAVAKACLFLPASDEDLKCIDHLANETITLGARDAGAMPFFEDCKALCEYRQGRFASAVEWAKKPLQIQGNYVHGHAYAVLAMAHWQLGEKDEARAMLAKGNALDPSILPLQIAEDPGNAWVAWLFARIALDEATMLIQPASPSDNKLNTP